MERGIKGGEAEYFVLKANLLLIFSATRVIKMSYERYRKMQFARSLRSNQTESEKIIWEMLRGRRFLGLKFRRQHTLQGYVVDFYCPELKLAIESDGKVHQLQKEYDGIRQTEIEFKGISFIRIKSSDVTKNPNKLLDMIKEFRDKHNRKNP
jgi:very-short-patch-repair endonuclease